MSSASTFGQNQWLVDEMFQQFQKDPNSVDKEWRELFESQGAPSATPAATPDTAPAETSPKAAAPAQASAPKKPVVKTTAPAPAQNPAAKNLPKMHQPDEIRAAQEAKKIAASPLSRIGSLPGASESPLRGTAKAIAKNMEISLEVPTATSVRDMPVRLMFENRAMINDQLARGRGGKISFTHILGYALVKAVMLHPVMNNAYAVVDNKPTLVVPEHINLGLAIDMTQKDGSRALVVAAIRECERLSFPEFVAAYEDVVKRGRTGKLTGKDFSGVTISLTNPGGIGTRHSVPRLTKGQGAIIGVGSMDYPAEFAGASEDRMAELGVGKLVTITSTYDHRIIQGAESGEFLRTMSQLQSKIYKIRLKTR